MLVFLEVGRFVAVVMQPKADSERTSLGVIEGAIFALFGLLMAFTFSGAGSRFNEKRMLIAEEANTIETSYLRLQLLPEQVQPKFRELFREYLDSRLEIYRRLPDMDAASQEIAKSKELQKDIWVSAVAASVQTGAHPDTAKLLLPALNNMIDITTSRTMALQIHPPRIVFGLLFVLGLFCSLLAGYRMANTQRRNWMHLFIFALVTATVVYVTLDLEYPRSGLFRFEVADQVLVNLRQEMN